MARLNDIPSDLLTKDRKAAFIDWLTTLTADLFSKKQLARLWSQQANTTISYTDMRRVENSSSTIK
jgi:hypothetical protein